MTIIVLYTFDFNSKHPAALTMLECSIITVKRELGKNAKIYLYTTTLKELFYLKYLNIEIRDYNYKEFGQSLYKLEQAFYQGDTNNIDHFKVIGHARMYIIKKLLQDESLPILYMDDDTGITHSYGPKLLELAQNTVYPIGYNIESWTNIGYFEPKLINANIVYNDIKIDAKYNTINNGIQFFPHSQESILFVNNMIAIYELLMKTYAIVFNDLFAFTAVWHSLPVKKVFIDPIENKQNKKLPLVIHYYYLKYHDKLLYRILRNYIEMYKACVVKSDYSLQPNSEMKNQYILNILYKYPQEYFIRYPLLLDFK